MEISDVRRRVTETVERAKRSAGERRARADEAARDYATFLDSLAVPLVRQVANVLKVQGYLFGVFTPSGSVRLASEKSADDYIEIARDWERANRITVRDDLRQHLEECLDKLRAHTERLAQYEGWRELLLANPEQRVALDIEDWLFFFGRI